MRNNRNAFWNITKKAIVPAEANAGAGWNMWNIRNITFQTFSKDMKTTIFKYTKVLRNLMFLLFHRSASLTIKGLRVEHQKKSCCSMMFHMFHF